MKDLALSWVLKASSAKSEEKGFEDTPLEVMRNQFHDWVVKNRARANSWPAVNLTLPTIQIVLAKEVEEKFNTNKKDSGLLRGLKPKQRISPCYTRLHSFEIKIVGKFMLDNNPASKPNFPTYHFREAGEGKKGICPLEVPRFGARTICINILSKSASRCMHNSPRARSTGSCSVRQRIVPPGRAHRYIYTRAQRLPKTL